MWQCPTTICSCPSRSDLWLDMMGAFHSTQNSGKFRLVHQMERIISVWSDRNIRDHLWRWSSLTGQVISVGPKCPFLFVKIVVPSPALLYPAYKNNNQTRGDLGRVCATGMYRPIKHVEFPKFQSGIFAESKAPDDRANHIAKTLRLSICTIITVRVVESGHRMKVIKSQRSLKTK